RGTRTTACFCLLLSVEYGVVHTSLREASRTKCATVAPSARSSVRVRVITAVRQSVVQAERNSLPDDLRLGQHLQRGVNPECTALHTFCGRQRCELLEGGDVLGPAVRVAGVVEGVDADEKVARVEDFSPAERERKKDGVSRGYVGRRNVRGGDGTILRNRNIARQGRTTEGGQINVELDMTLDAERLRNRASGFDFTDVPLAVANGQRVEA